jgi:prepilin-type N-terminal cleavage/methylation domain-containing protein
MKKNRVEITNDLIKRKPGFSLIEVTLVLGIAAIIRFLTFSQFLKKTEIDRAGMAGAQIKLTGDATNAYISNHYDHLSTLTSSPAQQVT